MVFSHPICSTRAASYLRVASCLLPQYCPMTSRHSSSSILSPRNFTSFGPTDASSTHLRQGEPRLVPHLSLNLDIASINNSQSKPIATMTDLAKPQKIELESNHFRSNDDLVVTFQRTIRVPDNQQTSKLPPISARSLSRPSLAMPTSLPPQCLLKVACSFQCTVCINSSLGSSARILIMFPPTDHVSSY
jgi:hypothetical protein